METDFSKKRRAKFPVKKDILSVISRFIEYDKCQGTVHEGSIGTLTTTVEVKRSVL